MAKKEQKTAEKREIKIRVTDKEYNQIKEKAEAKNQSLQVYVTAAALNRRDKKQEVKDYPEHFYFGLYEHQNEIAKLNQTIRELINKKLPDDYIYYSDLEDIAVTLRQICRHETELFRLIGGEDHDNYQTG